MKCISVLQRIRTFWFRNSIWQSENKICCVFGVLPNPVATQESAIVLLSVNPLHTKQNPTALIALSKFNFSSIFKYFCWQHAHQHAQPQPAALAQNQQGQKRGRYKFIIFSRTKTQNEGLFEFLWPFLIV